MAVNPQYARLQNPFFLMFSSGPASPELRTCSVLDFSYCRREEGEES